MSDGQDTPELKEVEIHGVKVSLPADQAAALIAGRDEKTKAYNDLQAQISAREAAEQAAVERAQKEEEQRIAIEAAQKGQLEQLQNLQKGELNQRDTEIKNLSIKAELSSNELIAKSAVPDVISMIAGNPNIVREGGQLIHKKADGTSEPFTAFLDGWVKERPYLMPSKIPQKAGGESEEKIPADVTVITAEEWRENPTKYASLAAANKLRIKE